MAVQPRTDWLKRAGLLRICPLCLAAGHCESDHLDALCERLAATADEPAVDNLCATHMTAFEQMLRESGVSSRAIAAVRLHRLDGLAHQLTELNEDGWLSAPVCGLCLERNEVILVCANRLLRGLARQDNEAGRHLAAAGGLCAAHFMICWEITSDALDREALARIQLSAVEHLAGSIRAGNLDDEQARAFAVRAIAITSM